jgi:oligopeptidase B
MSTLVPVPPVATRRPVAITQFDDTRLDDYFWLRERENPEVLAYLTAENEYAEAVLSSTAALQETLYQEMKGRIRESDSSAPEQIDDWLYYERTETGQDYPIYCRRRLGAESSEEILIDVNELAEGHAFCEIGNTAPSPDHRFFAFTVDVDGNESFTVRVKNLETGLLLPDAIPNAYYGLEWAADSHTLFYTVIGGAHRPFKLYRHSVGSDPAGDVLVFFEPDEAFFLELKKTRDGAYLVVYLNSNVATENWVIPAGQPAAKPAIIEPRRRMHRYEVEHRAGEFLILSDENCPNNRLVMAPAQTPGSGHWQELVAHNPAVLLEGIQPFAGHVALYERENGLRQIRILTMDPRANAIVTGRQVAFPDPVYALTHRPNPYFATNKLRFAYTTLAMPLTDYDYDMDTHTFAMIKRADPPGAFNHTDYVVKRLWATAADGVQVPISLVHRRDVAPNGATPTFLYGYGSYGYCIEPAFRPTRLSLLDRGFVFAIAHIRGGSDLGRQWYEDGKMLHKMNTFTDFIACAEHLIAEGYTTPNRLVVEGRSAGGLLMGAITNLRPDLFIAVHAGVPFVDVISTMLDATIPLTVNEYDEWGNPAIAEQYAYMRAYSPYDNLDAGPYPAILCTAGLQDPRVQYWEPAKYVAKLRTLQSNDTPILLKTNLDAGHGGASGRYGALRETAFEFAFFLHCLGISE